MTLQPVHHTRMHLFGHNLNKVYKCTVRYLDDTSWETTYSKQEDSQKVFDRICNHINLIEKDYFGLRFIDDKKQRKWLDLGKNARKQLKKASKEENNGVTVSFRVKFYPPDPRDRLNEELTRYQLFLQLRRDLQHGRLYGSSSDESLLLACILQSEVGDTPPGTDTIPYDYQTLMKHGKKGLDKALDQWTNMRGTSSAIAESSFLAHSSGLETFGIDPYQVKNDNNDQVFLGCNHFGMIAFQGSKKIMHLEWAHIVKMTYDKRKFVITFIKDSKKAARCLTCPTPKAAKHLWRHAIETKIFFTAPTSKNVPAVHNEGSLFSRHSRLRFSGRVAREACDNGKAQQRDGVVFQRTAFGQKAALGDAEVYEGVLATPGLHRRPSIYPVGKERDLSAARSAVELTPAAPASISASPDPPPYHESPPPGQSRPNSAGSSRTDSNPPEPAHLSPRNWPPMPPAPSSPSAGETLQLMQTRVEEVLSGNSNGSPRVNGRVSSEDSVAVVYPRGNHSGPLSWLAVGALVAGTSLLSVYTLFETNWLPAGLADLVAPLRISLYGPVKMIFSRIFFAAPNDTVLSGDV